MYKKMILVNIVLCIVLFFTFVCATEIFASPIQEEQAKTTEDTSVTEMVEGARSASPDVVLEERREIESVVSAPTEGKDTIATIEPDMFRRIVAIGDLPADYDPSLVLKKGRTIPVILNIPISGEFSFEEYNSFNITKNIYDDSGQFLLLPKSTTVSCWYMVSEEQGKMRINITAINMYLDLYRNVSVRFSNPPHCTTNRERKTRALSLKPFSSTDQKNREEDSLKLQEQLFISPVISAELILGVESEDRSSKHGRIIFGENASGDRTVFIEWGYKLDLHVRKDILFSGPYIGQIWNW